jgi:hypothetical protein
MAPPVAPVAGARIGPAPWSAAAIGAFILSLLGITAALGLLFAFVGLYTTRGGRRRGMALAIAAIPISLLTGTLAVLTFLAIVMFGRMVVVADDLSTVFSSGAEVSAQAATLRGLASADWNASVDDTALAAWLDQVRTRHGALTSATLDERKPFDMDAQGAPRLTFAGKFVNGPAGIRIAFDPDDLWSAKIDDIEVEGSSPRSEPRP